jgi:hypothetical protein
MQDKFHLAWKNYHPCIDFSKFIQKDVDQIGKWELTFSKICILGRRTLQAAVAVSVIAMTAPLHPISVFWFVGAGAAVGIAAGFINSQQIRYGAPESFACLSTLGKIACFIHELTKSLVIDGAVLALCFYAPYIGLLVAPCHSFYASWRNSNAYSSLVAREIKPLWAPAEAN